jgi:hypothetical protein
MKKQLQQLDNYKQQHNMHAGVQMDIFAISRWKSILNTPKVKN